MVRRVTPDTDISPMSSSPIARPHHSGRKVWRKFKAFVLRLRKRATS
jgi:hypothetical protein